MFCKHVLRVVWNFVLVYLSIDLMHENKANYQAKKQKTYKQKNQKKQPKQPPSTYMVHTYLLFMLF